MTVFSFQFLIVSNKNKVKVVQYLLRMTSSSAHDTSLLNESRYVNLFFCPSLAVIVNIPFLKQILHGFTKK